MTASDTASVRYPAVSLFSNCGAGDLGYASNGFRFDVIAELDSRRLAVAKLNHPNASTVGGDLRESLPQVVSTWRLLHGSRRPALLAACPPCQGMSTARGKRGLQSDARAGSVDSRNLLVEVIARAAQELQPEIIVVENVPAFLTRVVIHPDTKDPVSAAVLLISRLSADYLAFPMITNLADYGVPQSRRRAFITFVRAELPGSRVLREHQLSPFPRPTHAENHVSVRAALAALDLPALDASEKTRAADPRRPFHRVPVWGPDRYRMIAEIPPYSGGSAWENDTCPRCGEPEIARDLASCPECSETLLRPVVVEPDGPRLIVGFRSSSYARMFPDRPSAAITTASGRVGSDHTIHPWQNRVLSPLECAVIQTFPIKFRWGDTLDRYGHTMIRQMIGEAVPPRFTQAHGRVLKSVLTGTRPYRVMSENDPRAAKAAKLLRSAEQLAVSAGGLTADEQ